MKLLIHDLTAAEWDQVSERYEGWTVISEKDGIRPCIGCFRCWISGSGECVFKDGYNHMGALIHEADEMVLISRYTYGGFSSFVKNVFDRCIGYVLPEFETAYGEMHHKKRYQEDKPVTFIFRGCSLSEDDKEKARQYVAAVCRNLRGSVKDVLFEECEAEESVPIEAEAPERSGILLINCSLRGSRSNTAVFLERLGKSLGTQINAVSLSDEADLQKIAEEAAKAKTLVLGAPLYVDGLPSSALRLMKEIKKQGGGAQSRLYALVNNGLYESRQNVNMLSMIKDFCADCGFVYSGALAIGAGEAVGTLMKGRNRSLWPARNAVSGIEQLAAAITNDAKTGDIYADPYLFPRWLYILIANVNWQRLKKR